jgi:hypothetical protein
MHFVRPLQREFVGVENDAVKDRGTLQGSLSRAMELLSCANEQYVTEM